MESDVANAESGTVVVGEATVRWTIDDDGHVRGEHIQWMIDEDGHVVAVKEDSMRRDHDMYDTVTLKSLALDQLSLDIDLYPDERGEPGRIPAGSIVLERRRRISSTGLIRLDRTDSFSRTTCLRGENLLPCHHWANSDKTMPGPDISKLFKKTGAPLSATEYMHTKQIPQLFQAIISGLLFHKPNEPLDFVHNCFHYMRTNVDKRIAWDMFMKDSTVYAGRRKATSDDEPNAEEQPQDQVVGIGIHGTVQYELWIGPDQQMTGLDQQTTQPYEMWKGPVGQPEMDKSGLDMEQWPEEEVEELGTTEFDNQFAVYVPEETQLTEQPDPLAGEVQLGEGEDGEERVGMIQEAVESDERTGDEEQSDQGKEQDADTTYIQQEAEPENVGNNEVVEE